MAVDDAEVIDFISTTRDTGEVVLSITDHLEWDKNNEHLPILQAKINLYLQFVESGQLAEEYPNAEPGIPVRIDVACKYRPSKDGLRFLKQARKVIEDAGWGFTWSTPPVKMKLRRNKRVT